MALADKARGQRIAEFRKRRRLTQQAMAEQLQIAYRTYQTWEAGTMPEWPNLERLATFHNVRPEDIVGDEYEPDRDPSQLDRIEAKLDEILDLLDLAGIRAPTPGEIAEKDADRLEKQRGEGAASRPRKRGSGRAA